MSKKVLNTRKDAIDKLVELADNGFCPQLLFDDDGHWAVALTSITQPAPDDNPMHHWISVFVAKQFWYDTPEQAIEAAYKMLMEE